MTEDGEQKELRNIRNAFANGMDSDSAEHEIRVSEGKVSMDVSGRSLVSILDQLSVLQTDVRIVVKDTRIDRPASARFRDLPLDAALRVLVGEEDLLLLYGTRGETESVLKAAVIYPKGEGEGLMPSDVGEEGETGRLATALDSSDEAERGRAVQGLIDRLGMESLSLVLRALDDPSDNVRKLALSSALEAALTLPVETVIRLATTDAVPSVRMSAMEALGSNLEGADAGERLRAIAEVAATDPDVSVREAAARMFERLTNERTPPDR